MITAVSIFSCTNDYDPGLIENLGMKEPVSYTHLTLPTTDRV